jgi:hypothetical protein
LSLTGFLFLTNELFINFNSNRIGNLKKTAFSFTLKNTLKRYIIKKYMRYKFNYLLSNKELIGKGRGGKIKNMLLETFTNLRLLTNQDQKINDLFFKNNFYYFSNFIFQTHCHNEMKSAVIAKNFNNEVSSLMGIKRIKFKPGYMNI